MTRPARIEPGPGQESVWDYPRPPRTEPNSRRLVVEVGGVTIADTTGGFRVLETSQPPAFYLPLADIRTEHLRPTPHRSFCEWKGHAHYWTVEAGGEVAVDAAWSYPDPTDAFRSIRDHLAFYPQRVGACSVDGERVQTMDGSFYGGWITSTVVGPFKGAPGTLHW